MGVQIASMLPGVIRLGFSIWHISLPACNMGHTQKVVRSNLVNCN